MPTAEQCSNCRKLGTRQCSYYTDEYGRECSNFEKRKPTIKLTENETRIVVIAVLFVCIAFVTLASISYFSGSDQMADDNSTASTSVSDTIEEVPVSKTEK